MAIVFNSTLPKHLDMQLFNGDAFTFLNEEIIIWYNKDLGEGFDLTPYNGELLLKFDQGGVPQVTITTLSGDIIFTDNVITFNKLNIPLRIKNYHYTLILKDKIDNTIVGTLLIGKLNVKR